MKDEYKGIRGFFRRRQHPVKIIMYIAKYLWLLLIPLAKYLIATQFDFESWVKTNWVDILTLSVIFGYGILRWVFIYFEIEEDSIIAHTGYFGIEKTQVYFSEMSSMSLCQGYIFRLLGACTVYIDTDAKSIQSADIRLDISQKQAFRIYELATQKCRSKPKYIFNTQKRSLLIFSLLFSSTLSGMLLTLTFIYQAYRIVGREIEEEFLAKVNTQLEKMKLTDQMKKDIYLEAFNYYVPMNEKKKAKSCAEKIRKLNGFDDTKRVVSLIEQVVLDGKTENLQELIHQSEQAEGTEKVGLEGLIAQIYQHLGDQKNQHKYIQKAQSDLRLMQTKQAG